MKRDGDHERFVTFKDLYVELTALRAEMTKLKIGVVVVGVMVMSPKLSGPDPSQIVSAIVKTLA